MYTHMCVYIYIYIHIHTHIHRCVHLYIIPGGGAEVRRGLFY